MGTESVYECWEEIKNTVKMEHDLSHVAYTTFIMPLEIASIAGNELTIHIQGKSIGETYYNKRFKDSFMVAIADRLGIIYDIKFVCPDNTPAISMPKVPLISVVDRSTGLMPNFTFDEYVVADFNRAAQAAALAVAEQPGDFFNPLYIYGDPGLGKTHLIHAIGNYIEKYSPEKKILYVTAEIFTNEIINALRNGRNASIEEFREKYRNVDVLLIDDIQFIAGKEATQEEFFHTFNDLQSKGKQIVLTSDRPPKELDNISERMKSRFVMGLIQELMLPDYEARLTIVKKRAEQCNLSLDEEVLRYIATNIKNNIRELSGAINKLRMFSLLSKETINVEVAEKELASIITPEKPAKVTIQDIMDIVCERYGVTRELLLSKNKTKEVAFARQIVMYLASELTELSQGEIGSALGGRDHSTIIYGIRCITTKYNEDSDFQKQIDTMKKLL